MLWHVVFIVCIVGAVKFSDHQDWLWLFGGMYALERALSRFIYNSNRNWFMHNIDWDNNENDEIYPFVESLERDEELDLPKEAFNYGHIILLK